MKIDEKEVYGWTHNSLQHMWRELEETIIPIIGGLTRW